MKQSRKKDMEERLDAVALVLTEVIQMCNRQEPHKDIKSYILMRTLLISVGRGSEVIAQAKEEADREEEHTESI